MSGRPDHECPALLSLLDWYKAMTEEEERAFQGKLKEGTARAHAAVAAHLAAQQGNP